LLLIARPGCVLVPRTPFRVPLVMMKPSGEQAALIVAVTVKLLIFHVVLHQKVQNAELNFTAVRATPKRRSNASIGMMQALSRHVARVLNTSRKDTRRIKRKLKREVGQRHRRARAQNKINKSPQFRNAIFALNKATRC
jgi:hypothetical protein